MDDPFIRDYIEDLLRTIRTQVLLQLLKAYTRIRIPFISQELNIPEAEVQSLLVSLILDNEILGHIDQVNQLVLLHSPSTPTSTSTSTQTNKKYKSLEKWASQLDTLHRTVIGKLSL